MVLPVKCILLLCSAPLYLYVPSGWIPIFHCRGGGWVVPAAAQCHITATQCEEQEGWKKEGREERKRETYENNWDEEGESCLEVENRERSWLGGRKRKRDASYQNISMQSSCWCGEDCRLSTAAAAFSKLHRSVTQTRSTHYTINRHNNSHHCLWENRGTRKGLPFPCQFVQKSFIYPVIDPCHPLSFSRGAY